MIITKDITDFSNGINIQQFHEEIVNSDISSVLKGVSKKNNVQIKFETDLTEGDLVILNNLISAHVPVQNIVWSNVNTINLTESTFKIKANIPKMLTFYRYKGSNINSLKKIELYSYTDSGDYTITIIDDSNGLILCNATFNNTVNQKNVIAIISNIPQKDTILKVLVKNTNNSTTFINSISFYT